MEIYGDLPTHKLWIHLPDSLQTTISMSQRLGIADFSKEEWSLQNFDQPE